MLRFLYRQREKKIPKRPLQLDFSIDQKFSNNLFLDVFKSGIRVITYCNSFFIPQLINAQSFAVDGTFFSSPKLFKQILTVGVFLENQFYPVFFTFLSSKSKKAYDIFFEALKLKLDATNIFLDGKSFKIDYEDALKKSIMQNFPFSSVSGCFFHFSQCLIRRLKKLSLFVKYSINKKFYTFISIIKSLAYLPVNNVNDAFVIVKECLCVIFPNACHLLFILRKFGSVNSLPRYGI